MAQDAQPKIFVAGHSGMVGSAIVRQLLRSGVDAKNIITRTRLELDLCNQQAVRNFFADAKPNQVYLAAAKVGGIFANNSLPADFIYENLMIATNVIEAACSSGVRKLLALGSSCIYPRLSEQPISESALLAGLLEPTNEPYAIAKIAGIKLCESFNRQYGESHGIDYRSVMPTNLFGPGDNFHPKNSHVLPALIIKFHEAKIKNLPSATIWGSGKALREFMYVDDMASACEHVMNLPYEVYSQITSPMQSHINIGSGSEVSISELAQTIKEIVGFQGSLTYDTRYPDGTPRKLLNSKKLQSLGWQPTFSLSQGIRLAYDFYLKDNCLRKK
jgi:GDP-L-fucose synthase